MTSKTVDEVLEELGFTLAPASALARPAICQECGASVSVETTVDIVTGNPESPVFMHRQWHVELIEGLRSLGLRQ